MFEEKIKNLNYDKLGRMLGNAKKIVDDLREGKNEEYIICIFNKEYVYRDGDLFFNGKKILEKQKWKIFSIIKELETWLEFYHKCGVPEEECVCSDGDNAKNFYGVGILAYPGMLDKIAELLEDDFYFYAKNSIYSTITPCNENYDGLLLKAPVNWNPMTCKECAFSPYVHKYDRKRKKIETVYYVNK